MCINQEITEFTACIDCFEVAMGANDADPDREERIDLVARQRVLEFRETGEIKGIVRSWHWSHEPENHDEFSFDTCELCNSTLGGERFEVELVINHEPIRKA